MIYTTTHSFAFWFKVKEKLESKERELDALIQRLVVPVETDLLLQGAVKNQLLVKRNQVLTTLSKLQDVQVLQLALTKNLICSEPGQLISGLEIQLKAFRSMSQSLEGLVTAAGDFSDKPIEDYVTARYDALKSGNSEPAKVEKQALSSLKYKLYCLRDDDVENYKSQSIECATMADVLEQQIKEVMDTSTLSFEIPEGLVSLLAEYKVGYVEKNEAEEESQSSSEAEVIKE